MVDCVAEEDAFRRVGPGPPVCDGEVSDLSDTDALGTTANESWRSHAAVMSNYRRLLVPGSTYFVIVNLLERRRRLLVDHADLLRRIPHGEGGTIVRRAGHRGVARPSALRVAAAGRRRRQRQPLGQIKTGFSRSLSADERHSRRCIARRERDIECLE